MIITEKTSKPIDKIAISEEKKFQIKASAKAFKLLSSTIYPDPIAAPIRELATNAYDSHVEAGTTEPFVVHLPNELEPFFSIRDYGTGMDEEKIDKVYCTYFESTRSDSNNFTGAFGLGSKTPFCYSDTFSVTSFYNGTKTLYTAFLEQGEPKMAKFAEEPTDEKNGILISFPVKPEDFSRFISTAKTIYSRFKVKPIVVGAAGFKLEEYTYTYQGTDWRLRNEANSGPVAVMGNIGYRIDSYKLGYHPEISDIQRFSIEIDFPIGELQPSVSREDIQYDSETITKIVEKLKTVKSELVKIAVADVEGCASYYEARVKYHHIMSGEENYPWELKSILSSIGFKYGDKTITTAYEKIETIIKKFIGDSYDHYKHYSSHLGYFSTYKLKGGINKKLNNEPLQSFSYSQQIKYLVNDELSDDIRVKKVKHFMISNNIDMVYVQEKNVDVKFQSFFKEYLGLSDSMFINISSLPLPPKPIKTKSISPRTVRPRNLKELSFVSFDYNTTNQYRSICDGKEVVDINETKDFYYVDTFNNRYQINGRTFYGGSQALKTAVEILNESAGSNISKIYLFSPTKKLTSPPSNWKNIAVKLEEFYLSKDVYNSSELKLILNSVPSIQTFMLENLDTLEINNETVKEMYKIYTNIKRLINTSQHFQIFENEFAFKHESKDTSKLKKLTELSEKISRNYPFLNYVKTYDDLSWREQSTISSEKHKNDIKKMFSLIFA